MTSLVLGASFDLGSGYSTNVWPEPLGLPLDGGDNNDGITILDISQPHAVKYSFVFFLGNDYEDPTESILMTPLLAGDYLSVYYDRDSWDGTMRAKVTILERSPLINGSTLGEASPCREWAPRPERGLSDSEATVNHEDQEDTVELARRSLTDMSLNTILEYAMDGPDLKFLSEDIEQLPVF